MNKTIKIKDYILEGYGDGAYLLDDNLYLYFISTLSLDEINKIFINKDNLLNIKLITTIDSVSETKQYINYCVCKEIRVTFVKEGYSYTIVLQKNDDLAEALTQITDLQLALVELYEGGANNG